MKRIKKGRQRNPLISVSLGALLCAAMLGAVCMSASALSSSFDAPLAKVDPISLIALLVSGAASGLLLPKITSGKLLFPALSALMFVLVMLSVGMISEKGHLPVRCPVNYLCYMGVTVMCAYFMSRKKPKRRH